MLKKIRMCVALMGIIVATGSASGQQSAPTQAAAKQASEGENKKLAAAFFRKGITPEERLALLHPDYVQHNPVFKRFSEINGLHGKEAVVEIMKVLRAGGAPPAQAPGGDPTYLLMADGDLVTVLQKRQLPDPQNPGRFYEGFWFETWRVKDGKLYEHWDAATIPDKIPDFLQHPLTPK